MRLNLSVSDTNILKGVALILLLTHHLFYIDNGLYSDIVVGDHGLVNNIGHIAKVCVAIFVILSGYGLTASAEKQATANLKTFYVHRYVKLYLNYWLIWLLFVPIGILIFDFTFEKAYGADYLYPLLADLTGTLNLCGKYGYNPTWWFYSCIIVLYLLFPLIYKMMQNRIGCISVIVVSIALFFAPFTFLAAVKYYLFPFVLGMMMRMGTRCNILPPPDSEIGKKLAIDEIYL